MRQTITEIVFSAINRNEDGTEASNISIKENLLIEFDMNRAKFKASDTSGHSSRVGWGRGQNDAIMDYLQQRLGIDLTPPRITYSSSVYSKVVKQQ